MPDLSFKSVFVLDMTPQAEVMALQADNLAAPRKHGTCRCSCGFPCATEVGTIAIMIHSYVNLQLTAFQTRSDSASSVHGRIVAVATIEPLLGHRGRVLQFINLAILLSVVVIVAAVYWIAIDSAVTTAQTRRERLIQDLSNNEGPAAE